MKLSEFHSRLKEFQLAGVAFKSKRPNGWVINWKELSFTFSITVIHRDRVNGVTIEALPRLLENDFRKKINAFRDRRVQVPQKALSPNQFFDILGKIARGEI